MTEEQDRRFVRAHAEGLSDRQLSERFGLAVQVVHHVRLRLGLTRNKHENDTVIVHMTYEELVGRNASFGAAEDRTHRLARITLKKGDMTS